LIYTVLAAFFDLYNNRRTRKARFLGKMELIMKITEKKFENVDEIKGLLTEKQSADYLNISYETLRKNLRPKKKISFVRISNSVRYKQSDLDAYVKKCRVEAVD
jgi:excisionase family DNA binding protein